MKAVRSKGARSAAWLVAMLVLSCLAGIAQAQTRAWLDRDRIAFGETTTLNELIAALEAALGKTAIIQQLPEQKGDMPLTSAGISKARRLLGYEPHTKIADGIPKFVAWYRSLKK